MLSPSCRATMVSDSGCATMSTLRYTSAMACMCHCDNRTSGLTALLCCLSQRFAVPIQFMID